MRNGASRIAVGAFSRGRWYLDTPPAERLFRASPEVGVYDVLNSRGAECAIFVRHECAVFVRR
jgi:hypothetical protein